MRTILAVLFSLLAASMAHATSCAEYGLTGQQPWVAYGGVNLSAGSVVLDSTPFTSGLRGEVRALPYVVPLGQILFFEGVTIETLWGVDFWPEVGPATGPPTTALDTYSAGPIVTSSPSWTNRSPTKQFSAGFQVPSGLALHAVFAAGSLWPPSGGPWQVEWSMHGFLCNAT